MIWETPTPRYNNIHLFFYFLVWWGLSCQSPLEFFNKKLCTTIWHMFHKPFQTIGKTNNWIVLTCLSWLVRLNKHHTFQPSCFASILPLDGMPWKGSLRAPIRWGPGSKFLGTNLDSFEENWVLELDRSLHLLVLQIMRSLFLSSLFFFWSEPIGFFPYKIVPWKFNLYLTPFFESWTPHSKGPRI